MPKQPDPTGSTLAIQHKSSVMAFWMSNLPYSPEIDTIYLRPTGGRLGERA